ncbi:ribonuclease H-like domain-containing protein [Tanacetum coccineum]
MVLSLFVSCKWPIHQLDVKNAFLNDDLSENVYMRQPPYFVNARQGSHVAYLLLYVDDIILTASSTTLFQQLIDSLHREFDMTDLGALNYFLGIFVVRHSTVDTDSKLGPNGVPVQDPTLYRSFTLYASSTTSLVGYTNADWACYPSTRSAEAEYRGVANIVAETAWLRNLLGELHSPLSTAILVYRDNVCAVYMSVVYLFYGTAGGHVITAAGGRSYKENSRIILVPDGLVLVIYELILSSVNTGWSCVVSSGHLVLAGFIMFMLIVGLGFCWSLLMVLRRPWILDDVMLMACDEHPYQVGYGFGYAKSTDDYKVVGVSNADNKVKMYSLNTGNWKNLSDFPHGCRIVSFDLETEIYDEVLHPKYDEGNKTLDLGVLGGWLCMVCNYDTNHVVDVWVMKDYGEKDSWTKLVSIPYPVGYGNGYAKSTDDYKVVGVSNADNKVKMYSLNTENWKNLSDFPHGCRVRDDAVFLKGCVQWLDTVPNLWKIVSFDLETESYDEVLHPEYDEGNKTLDLGVLGGWLCVVCNYDTNHVADAWVMKDYGEEDSRTKLLSIPYPDPLIQPFLDIQES